MKYRKKPVEVDAIQFHGGNYIGIKKYFPTANLLTKTLARVTVPDWESLPVELYIITLEGNMKVNNGDWIVKGIAGEFYPVKPDIFEQTYEKVEEI